MQTVPYLRYDVPGSRDLFVLLHGQQSSKKDWLEKDGYTHGGNITEGLMNLGLPFIAFDLFGHGDSKSVDYSKDYLDDDEYQDFIGSSVQTIGEALCKMQADAPECRLHLLTYSTGSVAGLKLQEKYDLFKNIFLAVPVPQKEYDDEFSLHNNISNVHENNQFVIFYGKSDDEVSAEETSWFFEQVACKNKKIFPYSSGHSLPIEWVQDFISQIK